MSRILVVEDNAGQSQSLQRMLRAECFVPAAVCDGTSAVRALRQEPFDCVLLSDAPPTTDGFACCQSIRETSHVPIILLSRGDDTLDKIRGLDLGADEVLSRPFDPRELVARIRAVLRGRGEYSASRKPEPIVIGGLVLDTVRHEARMDDGPLRLTHREYAILRYLAEHAGEAVPRARLFEEVWGYDAHLGGKLLEVYIRRVRGKMEPDPQHPTYIQTVRGFGYRLSDPQEGGGSREVEG